MLDDVYFAPKLEYNLLSVGQLMKKSYSLLVDDGQCVIRTKATSVVLMTVKVSNNNMFLVDASKNDTSSSSTPKLSLTTQTYICNYQALA